MTEIDAIDTNANIYNRMQIWAWCCRE